MEFLLKISGVTNLTFLEFIRSIIIKTPSGEKKMKKAAIFFLVLCLTITFFSVNPPPVRADRFWSGVAIGVGSAIILGHLFHPYRVYYHEYPPERVYHHPPQGNPPPPAYRERWIPGRWVETYNQYGNYERYWVPEHWERID
jgi:hypothetical protein